MVNGSSIGRSYGRTLTACWLAALCIASFGSYSDAQVVINELMYHSYEPWPETQPHKTTNLTDFVEIYNHGGEAVDLGQYRFDNGISFDFDPGTMLAPGAYAVLCEHIPSFTNAYPTVTNLLGQFGGNLSNGGERITLSRLVDGQWVTEDTIHYIDDDASDGTGYSLELVHPGLHRPREQYYGDWRTSSALGGTPGVINSVYESMPPPIVGDVAHEPPLPPPGSAVKITARATGRDGDALSSVTLRYRKSLLAPPPYVSVPMWDDGSNGDEIAGDGFYTALIPTNGSAVTMNNGDIVEFLIDATDIAGTQTFPATNRADAGPPYAYLIKFAEDDWADTAYPGEYETFHILMSAANKNTLETRGVYSDIPLDATIITSGGDIYYNAGTRYRGGSSRNIPPRNYRIDIPNGRDHDGHNKINLNHYNSLRQHIGMAVTHQTTGGYAFDTGLARMYLNGTRVTPGQGIFHRFENFGAGMMDRIYGGEDAGNEYSSDGDFRLGRLQYVNDTPSSYYSLYYISINNPYRAWHEMVDISRALNQPAEQYPTILTNHMNIRGWSKLYATQIALNNLEAGFLTPHGTAVGDELRLVVNPQGQFDIFPWDYDDVISVNGNVWGAWQNGAAAPIIRKFLHNPPILPYYIGDVYHTITEHMAHTNMSALFDAMGSKMAGLKAGYLNTIQSQRGALVAAINTELTIAGFAPGASSLTVPSTNVGTVVTVTLDQRQATARWVYLGSLEFPGQGDELVRLTRTVLPFTFTVADALMFSNAVAGSVIVENGTPEFSTVGTWSVASSGGYLNGSYHRSSAAGSNTATWRPVLPQPGVYDVYAWLMPAASDATARYDLMAVRPHLQLSLSGTAPQTYTDKVFVGNNEAAWDLVANTWSTDNTAVQSGDAGLVSLRAVRPDGITLKSLDFFAVAARTPIAKSDTVATDTAWSSDDGVIHVTGNVTVSPGVTLTLDPSTILLFNDNARLIVNGTLAALGSPDEPVQMFSYNGNSTWSIESSGASASVTISNALLVAGYVTASGGGALRVYDSEIRGSSRADGIVDADGASDVLLARTIVRNFAKTSFATSPTRIEHSLFENMTDAAIEFSGAAAQAEVVRTTIRNPAGTDGIRFSNAAAGQVTRAHIDGVSGAAINAAASTVVVSGSLIENCGTGVSADGASSVQVVGTTIVDGSIGLQGSPSVTNTIAWDVATPVSGAPDIAYSDIQQPGTNVYAGMANLNRDPLFRLTSATDYRLRTVSPCRASGLGGLDRGAQFPVGANPATPSAMLLTAVTNSVRLSWQDNGTAETAFELERLGADDADWRRIATLPADTTNYTDKGLVENTDYAYRLRAVNNRGASFYTEAASATTSFLDQTQLLRDNLRITELMYHPTLTEDEEFIEFKNISETDTLNLSGLRMDPEPAAGSRFVFANGTLLPPQGFFVVARIAAAFSNAHPGVTVDGVYLNDDKLSNSGEEIWVKTAAGIDVLRFDYSDAWYPSTDGDGYSLVAADPNPTQDPSDPVYWRASSDPNGSPGADDPSPAFGSIVINEALTHQDQASGDWIELYNGGSQPVDLEGWFLSDTPTNLALYEIGAGKTIGASNYLVLTESADFGGAFALSELGESIYLSSGSGGNLTSFRTSVDFGAIENGVTFGRYVTSEGRIEFVAMSARTRGALNAAPRVGPIVINEIMYNPAAGGREFIELLNITGSPVPLYDPAHPTNVWTFANGIDYAFPTNTVVGPGEHILIVGIEPAEFRAFTGLTNAALQVLGPFGGSLANDGEAIELYRPGNPEAGGFVPRILAERVRYRDTLPWPLAADNGGPSLERIDANAFGNDPINWIAGSDGGTPGALNNSAGFPSVGFPLIATSRVEANEGVSIQLRLQPAVAATVTVHVAVSGGTATRNSDYTFTDTTLIFWPYETNKTVTLQVVDDSTPAGEPDETVLLALTLLSGNAILGGNRLYRHTIVDNDATSLAAPTIVPSVTTDFTNSVSIEIHAPRPDATIFYTLDGLVPTRDDIPYNGPFLLTQSARLTARTFLGSVNAGAYTSVLFRRQSAPLNFIPPTPPTNTVLAKVSASDDDAHETALQGAVRLTDPTIVFNNGNDYGAAFRFAQLDIPAGVTVTNARLQFTSEAPQTGVLAVTLYAHDDDNAPAMTTTSLNISGRPKTTASVNWVMPAWGDSERGPNQLTPNLAPLVQAIVDRPGWTPGNAIVFIVEYGAGDGLRSVWTFNGAVQQAAGLTVQWADATPPPDPAVPEVMAVESPAQGQFKLVWASDPLGEYTVYRSTNLLTMWPGVILTSGVPADISGTNSFLDLQATNPAAFYLIGVSPASP